MNKKIKSILLGVISFTIMCIPSMFLFGCSTPSDLAKTEDNLKRSVEKIDQSEGFSTEFELSVYQGKTGGVYNKKGTITTTVPNYNDQSSLSNIENKISEHLDQDDILSPYSKIRLIYDTVWGYSYKVITTNINIINSAESKPNIGNAQSTVDKLSSKIEMLDKLLTKQELAVNTLKLYLYDIGESRWENSTAYNAIYNYEKQYSTFVKAGLNLAISTTDLLNDVYTSIGYSEVKLSQSGNSEDESVLSKPAYQKDVLETIKMYYIYLAEENPFLMSGENAYINFYKGVYRDYLTYISSIFKGIENLSNYSNRLTRTEISNLYKQKEILNKQFDEQKKVFDRINFSKILVNKNGDVEKLSASEKQDYTRIQIFYRDILNDWWKKSIETFFSTGVIE